MQTTLYDKLIKYARFWHSYKHFGLGFLALNLNYTLQKRLAKPATPFRSIQRLKFTFEP